MSTRPELMSEAPLDAASKEDPLSDLLDSFRLTATFFSRAELNAPFGVRTAGGDKAIFHAVLEGAGWARGPDGTNRRLAPGDVVFFPHGDGHDLCDDPRTRPTSISVLATRGGSAPGLLRVPGSGGSTVLLCGFVATEKSGAHPLLSALPRVLHVRGQSKALGKWLSSTAELMSEEVRERPAGADSLLRRTAEAVLVHVLRSHLATSQPAGEPGWVSGLAEPQVARALALMHRRPQHPWTVEALAREIGLSRSAFHARFVERVGEAPLEYLTRWRMHLAARALREENVALAELAARLGYGSEAALSKAFKRVVGTAPGAFRRRVSESTGSAATPAPARPRRLARRARPGTRRR